MNIFEIYIAYVSWGDSGKRRPVLILEKNVNGVTVFIVTSRYEEKSYDIRQKYFKINDWKQVGLDRQSYIDTNQTVTLPLTSVDSLLGKLSAADEQRLFDFIPS